MSGSFLSFVGKISDFLGEKEAFFQWGITSHGSRTWLGEKVLKGEKVSKGEKVLKGESSPIPDPHFHKPTVLVSGKEKLCGAQHLPKWVTPPNGGNPAPQGGDSHPRQLAGCWERDEPMWSQPCIPRTPPGHGQGPLFPWWHPGILVASPSPRGLAASITKQYSSLSLAITEHSSWDSSGNLQCEQKESCSFLS